MSWSILIFRKCLKCASAALERITAIMFKCRRTGSAVLQNCRLECIPAYWVFITSALYNCSFVCRWQTAHCRLLARTKGHWIRRAELDGQRWQGKKRQWTECLSLPSGVCVSPFGNSSRGWSDILLASISLVVYLQANERIFIDKTVVESRFCNTAMDRYNVNKTCYRFCDIVVCTFANVECLGFF
jgi:hypothetical protein